MNKKYLYRRATVFSLLLIALAYLMADISVHAATAKVATTAPTFDCLNAPSVSSFVPGDTMITSQNGVNCFAWQVFMGLNWPAQANTPGQPDTSAMASQFGNPGNARDQALGVWETYANADSVFLPNAAIPGPFGTHATPWGNGPIPASCANDGQVYRVMTSSRKASIAAKNGESFNLSPETAQAFPSNNPNWLADKQGQLVYYEILFSQDQYNFIVGNTLYDANGQADMIKAHNNIAMPLGYGAKPGDKTQLGGLELKAAWLEVNEPEQGNWKTDFKLSSASIYDESTNTCSTKTLALVGLHIIHKTASQPQWVWATFEHKLNAPDTADIDSLNNPDTYTFYSKSCSTNAVPATCSAKTVNGVATTKTSCEVNTSPAYFLDKAKGCDPYPIQVSRDFKIKDTTDNKIASINTSAHELIKQANSNSVFANYILVNTLWSSAAINDNSPPGKPPLTPLSISGETPTISEVPVANTTLETYAQGFNCLSCHAHASVASEAKPQLNDKSYATDYSFIFGLAQSSSCYWMQNSKGYPWVQAPQGALTKQQCYSLNSCGEGGNMSGGGCYKWASGPNQQAQPWNIN
ncbi:hypothetical protein Sden_2083 [Shewanella denitrificans OS217]|jgi:hypothetical protein|uniref:Cytochrome c family protein n=1 Tax=Shewanella denitrificans (strain OS217 / ATCC BAA-1090 / DSM 15013) TaxID=318161 RepID=Q12MG1_SHEDO|nr:hypothetical protein [Shewanella denitrificans]ABE55365.1 hypothetical protein Sden_2083 [Shewanella denitrificans OS217]